MAGRAFLAKLGLATGITGTLASLGLAIGTDTDAANRIGVYSDTTPAAEKLGVVVGGSEIASFNADLSVGLDTIQFNLTPSGPTGEGAMNWSAQDGTVEVGMPGGAVMLQVGQEHLLRATATGSDIDNGQLAYISGGSGDFPDVTLGSASSITTASVIGMATEDITIAHKGFLTTRGKVREVDTLAYAPGTTLWLDTALGGYTGTRPTQPNVGVSIGQVVRQHATEGIIYADINIIPNLVDLSDVLISGPSDNDIIAWDTASGTWQATADPVFSSLTVDGKLTVTGLIDPTGLELTPVAANPGGTAANTVWLDSGNGNRWSFSNTIDIAGQGITNTGAIAGATTGAFSDDITIANTKGVYLQESGGTARQAVVITGTNIIQLGSTSNRTDLLGTQIVLQATLNANSQNLTNVGSLSVTSITNSGNTQLGDSGTDVTVMGGAASTDNLSITPSGDVSSLNPGSTTAATILDGRRFGHTVIDIYGNDAADSFAVRVDTDFDGTLDLIPFKVQNNGQVAIQTTTDSTSTSTGALVVEGGVGIAKDLHVGGDLVLNNIVDAEDIDCVSLTASGGADIDGQVTAADLPLVPGLDWTARDSAADNSWRSVCYGNGLFAAVAASGTGNRVMTSPDGINWTIRSSAADNGWRSICYGNGLFVAVSSSGTGNRVMTSPDGITWATRTSAADNSWYSVCYGNGLFVAVAYSGSGNRVMTSPDGINWTIRSSAADNNWTSVCYGNGLFVAVADSGTGDRVMTSPDGITWATRTSAADNGWSSVCYNNGLFVAVAYSGSGNRVMTSPDGINWTLQSFGADNAWYSVCYGNGLFVAVSASSPGTGDRVMTSPDGITWTIRDSASDNSWRSVCYGNGLFASVAASGGGGRVMTSGFPVSPIKDLGLDGLHDSQVSKLTVNDTTDSSSTSTGVLVVDGGVGIARKLYVGSDLTVTNSALAQLRLDCTGGSGRRYDVGSSSTAGEFFIFDGDAAATRLKIDASGQIDIQGVYDETTASAANVVVDTDGSLRRSTSSRRYKSDILPDISSELALKLRPVSYDSLVDKSSRRYLGFIAEEVAEHAPELVMFDDEGRPDALQYGQITAVNTAAIQGLAARMDTVEPLAGQVGALSDRVGVLAPRIDTLAARVTELEQGLSTLRTSSPPPVPSAPASTPRTSAPRTPNSSLGKEKVDPLWARLNRRLGALEAHKGALELATSVDDRVQTLETEVAILRSKVRALERGA